MRLPNLEEWIATTEKSGSVEYMRASIPHENACTHRVEPATASLYVTASGQADYIAEASECGNPVGRYDRRKPGRGRSPVATSIRRSRTSDTPSQENQPAITCAWRGIPMHHDGSSLVTREAFQRPPRLPRPITRTATFTLSICNSS